MRSVVASSDVFTSHSTWIKPLALVFHSHPIHGHAQAFLECFISIALYFLLYLFFLPFLMTDGDSVTMNHLCNSANGTFVTLDDYLPITFFDRPSGISYVLILLRSVRCGGDRVHTKFKVVVCTRTVLALNSF